MFLTAYNLAHYLIAKGLITTQSVVDGDFILAEAGRRNRNFKLSRRRLPGLFVKQVKSTEPQAIITIEREAAFYRAIGDPRYAAISGMIPRFIDYDPTRYALTLRLTEDAESLSERQIRETVVPPDLARQLGQALALIHSFGAQVAADPALRPKLPCQIPWPLNVDTAGYSFLSAYGNLGAQLTQAIQETPGLTAGLPALRAYWQYDSLTHGDMKWDNCLQRGEELVIVDWELADLGDGAWDVATIFKEYIASILMNRAMREAAAARDAPQPPEITLDTTRPSLCAFWKGYAEGRGLSGAAADLYLDRAVRFTAGRLVVAVLEYCTFAKNLDSTARTMLDYARRILEHPQIAAAQLAGVPAN
jgi:hypothetical protein